MTSNAGPEKDCKVIHTLVMQDYMWAETCCPSPIYCTMPSISTFSSHQERGIVLGWPHGRAFHRLPLDFQAWWRRRCWAWWAQCCRVLGRLLGLRLLQDSSLGRLLCAPHFGGMWSSSFSWNRFMVFVGVRIVRVAMWTCFWGFPLLLYQLESLLEMPKIAQMNKKKSFQVAANELAHHHTVIASLMLVQTGYFTHISSQLCNHRGLVRMSFSIL